MAWTTPKSWTNDTDALNQSNLNTHIRDNLNETAPAKAVAAGDIFYATAANAIARLAASAYKLIKWNSGGTAPEAGQFLGKGADVASATTITIADGNYVHITGTTTINHITTTSWPAGSFLILKFNASLTVTHNAGAPPANTAAILLSAASNFSATADDTLMLVYDGTTWREVARTVI